MWSEGTTCGYLSALICCTMARSTDRSKYLAWLNAQSRLTFASIEREAWKFGTSVPESTAHGREFLFPAGGPRHAQCLITEILSNGRKRESLMTFNWKQESCLPLSIDCFFVTKVTLTTRWSDAQVIWTQGQEVRSRNEEGHNQNRWRHFKDNEDNYPVDLKDFPEHGSYLVSRPFCCLHSLAHSPNLFAANWEVARFVLKRFESLVWRNRTLDTTRKKLKCYFRVAIGLHPRRRFAYFYSKSDSFRVAILIIRYYILYT